MRNRLYGGVRGRKMKVGGNSFIFLLLDYFAFTTKQKCNHGQKYTFYRTAAI